MQFLRGEGPALQTVPRGKKSPRGPVGDRVNRILADRAVGTAIPRPRGSRMPSLSRQGSVATRGHSNLKLSHSPTLAIDLRPHLGNPGSWRRAIKRASHSRRKPRRGIRDDRRRPVETHPRIDNIIQIAIADFRILPRLQLGEKGSLIHFLAFAFFANLGRPGSG